MELTKDNISLFISIKNLLDDICKKYFEANHNTNWQHYSHWSIDDKCETIYIHYSYEDFWSNTEMYTEVGTTKVSINELIEFSKMVNK